MYRVLSYHARVTPTGTESFKPGDEIDPYPYELKLFPKKFEKIADHEQKPGSDQNESKQRGRRTRPGESNPGSDQNESEQSEG